MDELREKIAKAMDEVMFARFPVTALKAADRILAIPELQRALKLMEQSDADAK